ASRRRLSSLVERGGRTRQAGDRSGRRARGPRPQGRAGRCEVVARDLGELNREGFARYKDDVKKEGKSFFPRAILHDTVMSLVVVSIIVALACIWYFDAG